jgi:Asp-tRNA(Asn)/Glu-tRNA(Gln) amidotransferase A subunit family amidase
VQIVRRADDRTVEAFEQAIADAEELCSAITSWENHFSYRYLLQDDPHGVSQRMQATLARAEAMTVADYQDRLREREQAQLRFAQTRQAGDAMLMLSSAGAAPPWSGDKDGEPLVARPTGDAVFNCPSSMLFASAVTVPLMAIDGLPAGVQLVAWPGEDAAVTAFAQWMLQAVSPVSV